MYLIIVKEGILFKRLKT